VFFSSAKPTDLGEQDKRDPLVVGDVSLQYAGLSWYCVRLRQVVRVGDPADAVGKRHVTVGEVGRRPAVNRRADVLRRTYHHRENHQQNDLTYDHTRNDVTTTANAPCTRKNCPRSKVYVRPTALPRRWNSELGQLGAANSATGQFGASPTRRRRFGAGTFRRSVSNPPYCPEFCSLPNKTAMIYQRFLDMMLELRANMNPHSISCDYEIALFNTVSAGFSNAKIFGCFFPFCEKF